jgi:hypothetical protein
MSLPKQTTETAIAEVDSLQKSTLIGMIRFLGDYTEFFLIRSLFEVVYEKFMYNL